MDCGNIKKIKNKKNILAKAKKIKVFAMDIDGVLTDGRIVFCKGEEIKYWNVKDRIAFFILNRAGYKTVWISGRKSREVEERAGDLKIKGVFLGVKNKLKIWKLVLNKFKIKREEILYIGDDLVDLPLLKSAGLSAAPADAADDVRKICDIVTRSAAGEGVLREITEFVLKTQNKWNKVLNYYVS